MSALRGRGWGGIVERIRLGGRAQEMPPDPGRGAARTLEDRLREVEARLNAVLEAAVDAIVMIDEEGRIELFSAAAERLFGWSRSEVLGRNVSVLMPDPFRSDHDSYLQTYLRTGIPRIIGIGREALGLHRDGTEFPIELSVGEIAAFSEGRRFVGIIRDIRPRVAAEDEARRHRERLAHVTRLSTLGEMAAGIAHEINQPLAAIATSAQACTRLLESGKRPEKVLEATRLITEQALRAGEVIRSLREFAKRHDSDRETVDLNELVRGALRLCEVDARARGVPVAYEPAPGSPRVRVEAIQVQQVVMNLVRNALESMEHSNGRQAQGVTVRTVVADGVARVSVVDRGAGVPGEARTELFHPFFTTKKEGMGMGLSICRSIVTAHGGTLDYRPNPEGGSTFRFTLPEEVRE
jgi:two-component system sensor kinase FixL